MPASKNVQRTVPAQPWVKELKGADLAAYKLAREGNIAEQADYYRRGLVKFLARVAEAGADGLDALIEEGATAIATNVRESFEGGIQVGIGIGSALREQEAERAPQFRYNVVNQENWS